MTSQRGIVRRCLVACAALLLCALAAGGSDRPGRLRAAQPAPDGQLPRANIVLILVNDADLAMMADLPELTSLFTANGATFSNFFVSNALCCPSRATILRGQYAHNHHVTTNDPPAGGFRRFKELGLEDSTVATWLQAGDYYTALVGKYLNNYPAQTDRFHIPPGWTEWFAPVDGDVTRGFDYALNENGRPVRYGRAPDEYFTDVLARRAVGVIRRAATQGAPFFLYVAPSAPHTPAVPAPRYADTFPDARRRISPAYDEADVSDKPTWVQDLPPLKAKADPYYDRLYRARLQSMLSVLDLTAGLLAALQDTGQLARTYLFFTSDNGYHFGEHRLLDGKETGYEEDIHVPLYVRGPGVPVGRTVEHLAANVDLAPTFAAIAGVAPPDFVDGRSLLPLLGPSPPPLDRWRRAVKIDHAEPGLSADGNHGIPAFIGIRTDSLVYIEYETGGKELYDLRVDPYELDNRVVRADPALLARLAAWLKALSSCAGAGCRVAEDDSPTLAAGR